MGLEPEIFQCIEALAAGDKSFDWYIIRQLNKRDDFDYDKLEDEEVLAMIEMCSQQLFLAEMSDCYAVTRSERSQISPIYRKVVAIADRRGIR